VCSLYSAKLTCKVPRFLPILLPVGLGLTRLVNVDGFAREKRKHEQQIGNEVKEIHGRRKSTSVEKFNIR
jgi:hypothetical protein